MKLDESSISIFESLYDGVLIADKQGIVRYVNQSYLRITGMKKENILNYPVEKIRPGSKLHKVIQTGEAIRHLRRKVGDAEYFSNLVPIRVGGEIIGGVSISSEIADIQELLKKLKHSETVISQLQGAVNQFNRARYSFTDIIGEATAMKQVVSKAEKIASGKASVLISGESGTGKELFAQAIHNGSHRRNGPFIAVNCATLSGELLESELFGYASGTFTGGKKEGKMGLFRAAEGGTIFLDEIGELDIKFQAKLLRALQEGMIRPLGDTEEYPIDVRVISATNRDLREMISLKTFREDLYYRIAVFELDIPPLRDRRNDIPLLMDAFRMRKKFPENIQEIFKNYKWDGNVRELRNAVQFCVEITDSETISIEDLPKRMIHSARQSEIIGIQSLKSFVKEKETEYIQELLESYGNDVNGKCKVAKLLGVSLATLYNKLDSK